MLGHHRPAGETPRADDGPLLVIFGSSHQLKKALSKFDHLDPRMRCDMDSTLDRYKLFRQRICILHWTDTNCFDREYVFYIGPIQTVSTENMYSTLDRYKLFRQRICILHWTDTNCFDREYVFYIGPIQTVSTENMHIISMSSVKENCIFFFSCLIV